MGRPNYPRVSNLPSPIDTLVTGMGTGALRGSWQGDFDCASLRFPCPWQEKVVPRPFCQTIISQGFFPKWHISPHKGRALFVFCQQCEESAKNLSLLFIHIWILAFFPYILKTRVLVVQTPQTICNFPQKDFWERENYQSQSLKANNSAMCYK